MTGSTGHLGSASAAGRPPQPAFLALCLSLVVASGCDPSASPEERAERTRERVEQARQKLARAKRVARAAREELGEVASEIVLPPAEEQRLGDQMARQIQAEAQLLREGPALAYVRRVARSLLAVVGDGADTADYEFHVLVDPAINAFAIPGGHVYLTTGLLRAAETEAEVAAVLAHEIAHVEARHVAKRMTAAYGASMLMRLAMGEDPGLLEQIATDLLAQGFLLKHSRDGEREADALGLGYVVAAGYSPKGYVAFFQRLLDAPRPPAILSTHPDPAQRIESARGLLADLDEEVRERPLGRDAHARATASLE